MDDRHIKPGIFPIGMLAFGRDVMGLDQLVALQGFQMNIKTPQPVQVLEHLVGRVAQRFAVVLLVAQGQRAIPTAVDAVDLYVGSRLPRLYCAARISRMVR